LFGDSGRHASGRKVDGVDDELVGMLGFDVVGLEAFGREVVEVG
jgi:hypothetical protein